VKKAHVVGATVDTSVLAAVVAHVKHLIAVEADRVD